jgi:hypothetical protein
MTRLVSVGRSYKDFSMTVSQGGFSDGVWTRQYLREYILGERVSFGKLYDEMEGKTPIPRVLTTKSSVFGWIGHSGRTVLKDKILEKVLRETGLEDGGVAVWLTSTDGRHIGDSVEGLTDAKEIEDKLRASTKDAFLNVCVWEHPDHDGSWSGTIKLREKIKQAFAKTEIPPAYR